MRMCRCGNRGIGHLEAALTIGIGIIGSGGMGLTWAEGIRTSASDARLVAVWGGSRSEILATQFGAAPELTLTGLLQRPDVDAVVIASPLGTHCEYVVPAARAGRH